MGNISKKRHTKLSDSEGSVFLSLSQFHCTSDGWSSRPASIASFPIQRTGGAALFSSVLLWVPPPLRIMKLAQIAVQLECMNSHV